MSKKIFPITIKEAIYYLEVNKKRNQKRITLRINYKNQNPVINIPYHVAYNEAVDFFNANQSWFIKQVTPFKGLDFTTCTTINYNGISYTIRRSTGLKNSVSICHPSRTIQVKQKSLSDQALVNFLKKQAFNTFYDLSLEKSQIINKPIKKVIIMDSKKWGACSSLGNLRYNFRVIMAPSFVQDYLVAHEVAHLKEFNHSKNFWDLVNTLTPYTKEGKLWLKQQGKSLY